MSGDRKIIRREELEGTAVPPEQAIEQAPPPAPKLTREGTHVIENEQMTAKRLFEDARRDGYAAGYEDGRNEFVAAIQGAVEQIRDNFFRLEEALLPIVSVAVERILGRMDRVELVQRVLREAMVDLGSGLAVSIRTSPDDLEMIRGAVASAGLHDQQELPPIRAVEADASLKPGEIILETIQGRTHIGPAYQMARLKIGLGALT